MSQNRDKRCFVPKLRIFFKNGKRSKMKTIIIKNKNLFICRAVKYLKFYYKNVALF